MDILTPKGQETLKQERKAIQIFTSTFPGFSFIETPKDTPADIDGIIVKDGVMISGVEVKCRTMTAADLAKKYNYQWLVTADKLERGVSACERLGIDFRGFLYLVPDDMLFIVPIFSYMNGWVPNIEYDVTETQKTVNGGTATRLNAYIDVSKAKVIAKL